MNTTGNLVQRQVVSTARRLSIRPGWVALVLVGLPFLVISNMPLVYQFIPLVASAVVLGMPHGAVDHLLLARERNESLTRDWMVRVALIYLVFGIAYTLVWFVAPVAAFVFFILLTWFHWGQGELYPLVELVGADYIRERGQRALTILTRGGAPMLVPLVAFPNQYEFVATSLVGLFDAGAAAALAPLFEPTSRAVVATFYGTFVGLTVLRGYLHAADTGPWVVDTGEILLLTAFFLLVPPVLAIGVYFCFWHSVRHIIRTTLLHDQSARSFETGDTAQITRQFVRDAAPLTAVALSFMLLLYVLVPQTPTGLADLVALYLVLIAVLTLPHVVIVTVLDRRQNIL